MTTVCLPMLSQAVGALFTGDLMFHGDGGLIILIGVGEALGMPAGMIHGIGGRTGIILRMWDTRDPDIRDGLWPGRA